MKKNQESSASACNYLLACPCGGSVVIFMSAGPASTGHATFAAHCTKCDVDVDDLGYTVRQARQEWNRRRTG
jgi:hypothetical protein